MAQEYESLKYYDHNKYIDPFTCNCLAIEYFLSRVLFHTKEGEPNGSRIIYSQDSLAFRKRIEFLDNQGFDENTEVNVTTLDLPFTNYSRSTAFEPDDRQASVTAAHMLIGDYDTLTSNYLKAMSVKSTFEGTAWFGRFDDAQMAFTRLQWEQNPKGPIWIVTPVNWYGVNLLIPSFITIEDLQFDPDFKEEAMLETLRLIPVKYKFTVRSYQVHYEKYDSVSLPLRFGDKYKIKDNMEYGTVPLTEKVTLNFMSFKEFVEDGDKDISASAGNIQELENIAYVKPGLEGTTVDSKSFIQDVVGSYFKDGSQVEMSACKIAGATSTSLRIALKVKPADQPHFDYIKILTPGHEDIIIDDCKTTGCVIPNLENNSEYHITVLVYGKDGSIKTIRLTGTTLDSDTNEAPQVQATTAAKKKYPKLIGYEFNS